MFAEYLYGDLLNKQKLADCLLANNYDIFIANYDAPTDDITRNADYIENVIKYINEEKNNKTELVVSGGSMGGLVTRVALATMEEKGDETQSRLWFSFDSPQLGANIPLGLQFWVKEINTALSAAGASLEKMNSPASKQMLLYHHTGYPNGNVISERTDFATELKNLGFPETCRNVAITCGASDGTGQGYNPKDKIIHITWKRTGRKRRYIYAWAIPDGGTDFAVCKKVKVKSNGTEILLKEYKISNTNPIDNAPGGFYPTMKIASEMTTYGLAEIEAHEDEHAFIPAISALALDTDDYFARYGEWQESDLLNMSPFDMLYFPTGEDIKAVNQEHVWISLETAENILKELFPEDVVLGNNPDWQQGEVMATRSIHLASGFHASASDEFHLHIVEPINILEEEFWSEDNKSSIPNKKKNISLSENENIAIYPNPTTGIFTIDFSSQNLTNSKITIIDLTGKKVFQNSTFISNSQIDISNQPNGIYFLEIQTKNDILTLKIIKQ